MDNGQSGWTYSHTEHSWPVVNVFVPGSQQLNKNPILKQKLQILQQVESINHLRGGVVNLYNPSDTSWLIAAQKMGYRYAVVWHDGCWASSEEYNDVLLTEIDRFNDESEGDWLIAGQLNIDTIYYPWFNPSVLVINIAKWMEVDQPNPYVIPSSNPMWHRVKPMHEDWEDSVYGITNIDKYRRREEIKREKKRNQDWWKVSDHDHNGELKEVTPQEFNFEKQNEFGNAWIAWALRRRLYVWGLSDKFMDELTYTRPHIGTETFESGITGGEFDKTQVSYQARNLVGRALSPTSPVYFVNTEPSQPQTSELLENTDFDCYTGASAGFKLLYYAYKYGVNPGFTNFVFFDFDTDSVNFKRETLKQWDGTDYPGWVEAWMERNPDAYGQDLGFVRERWPTVVDQFGGTESWRDFWTQISFCDLSVVQCDLINGHDELFKKLDNKRTFMWSSNIYSYILPKLLAQPFQLESSFISLITKLKTTHADSWFSGTDINDNDIMCPASAILTVGDNKNIGFE